MEIKNRHRKQRRRRRQWTPARKKQFNRNGILIESDRLPRTERRKETDE